MLGIALAGCGTVDRDDLASDMEQVHSYAAEGALLANQASRGLVPIEFVWLHAQELRHRVMQIDEKLGGEIVAAEVHDSEPTAKLLVEAVAYELGLLHSAPNEPAIATVVQRNLERQAAKADDLMQELAG